MFSHIQTKLYLKLTIYFKTQSDISMEVSQKSKRTLKMFVPHPSLGYLSKELMDMEDVCPSSQSRILRKKIVCTKKAYEIDSVTSIWNIGTSIFNWNDFYELQRNTEGLTSYLFCYQLHWKVHEFSIFGT